MNRRKSAGFTVDDALWRRFKSKAADEGLPIGEMLVRFIGEYLDGKEVVKDAPRKSVSRKKLGIGGKKPRRTLETSGRKEVSDPPLARYASLFGIEDENEDSLRERVLDAIAKEYSERGDDEGWMADNLEMLEWHNRGGA